MEKRIFNAGNRIINRYLIELEEKVFCLVDTGYKWSYEKFCKKLSAQNIALSDIKYVVLTHVHADHAGFLKEFLAKNENAMLIYDTASKMRLEAGKNNLNVYISTLLNLISSYVSVAFVDKTQCFPAVVTDRFLPADTQPLAKYGVEIVFLKGHTAADIALKFDNKLFCGDVCMNGFPSSKHFPLWLENKFELVQSWEKILTLSGVDTLYPAHGKPFDIKELPPCLTYWRDKGVFKLFKNKR